MFFKMFLNSLFSIKQYILGLRRNKTFLKSKYTRTRQWSKSIVYFGLWFNLISIYLSFFYCYQFYFNLLEYWWVWYCIVISFFFRLFLNHINYYFFGKFSKILYVYNLFFEGTFSLLNRVLYLNFFFLWVRAEITAYYQFFLLKK